MSRVRKYRFIAYTIGISFFCSVCITTYSLFRNLSVEAATIPHRLPVNTMFSLSDEPAFVVSGVTKPGFPFIKREMASAWVKRLHKVREGEFERDFAIPVMTSTVKGQFPDFTIIRIKAPEAGPWKAEIRVDSRDVFMIGPIRFSLGSRTDVWTSEPIR